MSFTKLSSIARKAVLLFLLAVCQTAARAEAATLTFAEAWSLALERNDQLAAAKDEAVKASYSIGEAYASAMPTASLGGSFQHYFQVPSSIFYLPNFEDPSGPRTRIKTQFGSENSLSLGLQINQPLWLAGKVGIALDIAKNYHELSTLGVAVARDELRLNLTRMFYGALVADEFVKVAAAAQEQAVRHRKQVQALFDQGLVSEYDLIRADVAVANAGPQVQTARAARDLAYKGLKNLLGVDVDAEVQLTGSLNADGQAALDYDRAVASALENRLELRQVKLQGELYRGQYQIESRNTYWPNLFLGLFYNTQAQAEDLQLDRYEFLGGWGGTVSIQVPLFDGFASHHRAQRALVEMRAVDRQRVQLERGVKIQVFQAVSDHQKASLELSASRETLRQAEKGLAIAETRYREGLATQLEVLDAQLQHNQAKVNLLQAEYALVVAQAAYERALGSDLESK